MKFPRLILKVLPLALPSIFIGPVWPQNHPAAIRVGIYQNQPKIFLNSRHQPDGFWPTLLQEIADAEGWQLNYIPCDWDDCLQAIENGELDLLMDVAYSPEREQRFDFNQEVVFSSWSVVYARSGIQLNSVLDLDQKRVAVLKDSIQYDKLAQWTESFNVHPEFVEVDNFESIFLLLKNGRVDAGVVNHIFGSKVESTYPVTKTNILVAPVQVHIIAPKSQNSDLLQTIDRHLKSLKGDPDSTYYRSIDLWLKPRTGISWRHIRPILISVGLISSFLGLTVILLWNRVLQQEVKRRHKIETALRDSETRLLMALEAAQIVCWEYDLETGQIYCIGRHSSEGWQSIIWEASLDDVLAGIHPEDRDIIREKISRADPLALPNIFEHRVILPNGEIQWIQVIGKILNNKSGEPIRSVGVSMNITERKQAEAALHHSETLNQQILSTIPDLLIWMGADGTCIEMAGGNNILPLTPSSNAIGTNIYDQIPEHLAKLRCEALEAAFRTRQTQIYEQAVVVNHLVQYEEVRVVPVAIDQALVIIRNISDRKQLEAKRQQAEQALLRSEERYRLVTENMSDLVCLHYPNGQYCYVSPSCQTLLGFIPEELLEHDPYEFFHPDDLDKIRYSHQQAMDRVTLPVTYRMRTKSGNYIWLETLVKPILDANGQVTHLQTTSRDVSDRVKMEQKLRQEALHDALTNLPNRNLLIRRLASALKRAKLNSEFKFAVLFLDFDHFKVINDSLGHLVGDQLLITIANKLLNFVHQSDLVARIGGDEFVILLEQITGLNQVLAIAKQILADLQTPLFLNGREVFISASIGIVIGSENHSQADDLVRDADIAMYQAKAKGRAGYAIFDPAMHLEVIQRLNLENDLRRALDHQELVLHYQPIVVLETLQITGFEALLRWQHPTLGLVTPNNFMAVAEETGLIVPIGEWVLQTACQQLADWQTTLALNRNLKMTVNLSVKQLQPSVLIPQLQQALHKTGIISHSLTLEITESLLIQNIETTSKLLSEVQARGVRISIDDFGTGYSSLSYLHQLPVDALKIDRAFVSPGDSSSRHKTIAGSIVGLSNLLGLNAIAEGIETVEQLHWLQTLKCEYGQGYLFSQPVSPSQAKTLLEQDLPFAHLTLPGG
jgi:diguanylate cyclase (GGDEF)-like protein/PAS domain S-box-containing protein